MSGRTVNSAIFLLVIGNAMALISDVFVKMAEPDAAVFLFAFMRSLITLLLLLPFCLSIKSQGFFKGARMHFLRAHIHFGGMVCMVIALTHLPLATANALFYVAPILVMVLSAVLFGERLKSLSLLAVISGFAGILVILRPVEFNWAAWAALGAALALALGALLVRKLPEQQTTGHKLLLNYLLLMPAAGFMAWWEGAEWTTQLLLNALGSAVFILGYNISVLLAYRRVDASQVTSAEYTGLIWAVVLGWVMFSEQPDLWFLTGSAMIVIPLVMIGVQQGRQNRHRIRI